MVDYLIIGQGIAGSVLAWQLLKAGQRILVIDNPTTNKASHVAAGLYNPVAGKYLTTTWLADTLFPSMEQFYKEIETLLKVNLLYPHQVFRPFLSVQEKIQFLHKQTLQNHNAYIEFVEPNDTPSAFTDTYGGLVIKQAGYVDIPYFLIATRNFLKKNHSYQLDHFDYNQVQFGNPMSYKNQKFKHIIFCEGPQVKENPFFSFLSFRLVKGELLTISLQHELHTIYNRSIYMVPKIGKKAIVGTTYDWQDLTLIPTIKAKETLMNALKMKFRLPYVLLNQQAGIRPATFDRRPFIGCHPDYPSMSIFNGLGTKGVSLAPYFAQQLVAHLLSNKALHQEVRLTRGN